MSKWNLWENPKIYLERIDDLRFAIQNNASIEIWLGPAQDVNFFYTGFKLSELQSCALIFSANFYFIFTFK